MLQYRPIQNILNSFVTFQVNYSQCLGVIGYSLIPLVLTAAALPLVHYFPMVSFSVKVINKNSLEQKNSCSAKAAAELVTIGDDFAQIGTQIEPLKKNLGLQKNCKKKSLEQNLTQLR